MPFSPSVQYRGDQYLYQGITGAANTLNEDLMKALQKYEDEKKQREFNSGVFDSMVQDPNMQKYIPVDALNRFHSMNNDKQAGTMAGIARRQASDAADLQRQNIQSEIALRTAQAQQAVQKDAPFTPQVTQLTDPTTNEPFAVYARGPHQVDLTPGSAASQRAGQPVLHPDTGKVIGLFDSKGNPKYFARETPPDPMKVAIAAQIAGTNGSPAAGPPAAAQAAPAAGASPEMKALAQKALSDPAATLEQKAAAKKILGL